MKKGKRNPKPCESRRTPNATRIIQGSSLERSKQKANSSFFIDRQCKICRHVASDLRRPQFFMGGARSHPQQRALSFRRQKMNPRGRGCAVAVLTGRDGGVAHAHTSAAERAPADSRAGDDGAKRHFITSTGKNAPHAREPIPSRKHARVSGKMKNDRIAQAMHVNSMEGGQQCGDHPG